MEDTCIFKEKGLFLQFDYQPAECMENQLIGFYPCCYYAGCNHNSPFDEITVKEFLDIPTDKVLDFMNNIRKNKLNFLIKPDMNSCVFPCNCVGKEVKYLNVSLDRSCNLHCRMCRERVMINKEETEVYYKVLDKCRNLHLDVLEFTTMGEPFLYKDRLFEYINTLTLEDTKQINFITNGTLLDEETIDRLKDFKDKTGINVSVNVSIDSIDEVGYKIVRGGDFNKVIKNTDYLKEQGLLANVLCTVSVPVLYQVPNIQKFWWEKGINVCLHIARPIGMNSKFAITQEEYKFCKNAKCWKDIGMPNID